MDILFIFDNHQIAHETVGTRLVVKVFWRLVCHFKFDTAMGDGVKSTTHRRWEQAPILTNRTIRKQKGIFTSTLLHLKVILVPTFQFQNRRDLTVDVNGLVAGNFLVIAVLAF